MSILVQIRESEEAALLLTKETLMKPQEEPLISFTIYRRHSKRCRSRRKGRTAFGCNCPIYGDGYMEGQRILRKSLRTRNAAKANMRMAHLVQVCSEALNEQFEECEAAQAEKSVLSPAEPMSSPRPTQASITSDSNDIAIMANAVEAYLGTCKTNGVRSSTIRKYRNSLTRLSAFMENNDVLYVRDVTVLMLDRFRDSRVLSPTTNANELQTMRSFFSYCVARDLCKENLARKINKPKMEAPNNVVPYTPKEIQRIIAATQEFGRNQYERKRAKAIILVLRFTALRISDVAVLRRDRITKEDGRWVIFIRATKNNQRVYLPIPRELKEALDHVPFPREGDPGCPYYFWSGKSKERSIVGVIGECVSAVFKQSGVKDAHAHRFRHTLATELLGKGGTFEEVADVLGDSVKVVEKHYAKWSPARQARVTDLLSRVHGDADWSPGESRD